MQKVNGPFDLRGLVPGGSGSYRRGINCMEKPSMPKHTRRPILMMFLLLAPHLHAQTTRAALTLETAQAISRACHDHARENGWRVAVAVNDEGGRLLHFSRMDGAPLISIPVAQTKADTASLLPISTREFRAATASNQGAQWLSGITTVAGGVPIRDAKGSVLGSVGVSGASEDQDEVCALAGLKGAEKHLR